MLLGDEDGRDDLLGSTGEGGSYLYSHCPQSEKGGVQVTFETPDRDDLGGKKTFPFNQILCFWVSGEFLEDVVSSSGWEECVKMMVEIFQ